MTKPITKRPLKPRRDPCKIVPTILDTSQEYVMPRLNINSRAYAHLRSDLWRRPEGLVTLTDSQVRPEDTEE